LLEPSFDKELVGFLLKLQEIEEISHISLVLLSHRHIHFSD